MSGDFIRWWRAVLLVVASTMPACQPAAVYCGGAEGIPWRWVCLLPAACGGRRLRDSSAQSYADRPVVSHPHALHFMGMSPAVRYRHMAAVAKTLAVTDVAPAELR